MNLAAMIRQAVIQQPEGVALDDGQVKLTYQEFHLRAGALARFFLDQGIKPGDRIAVSLPNVTEVLVLAYATWWVGGIFVPLNTRWSVSELEVVVNDAAPRFLVIPGDLRQTWTREKRSLGSTLLGVRDFEAQDGMSTDQIVAGREQESLPPLAPRKDGDPALLMYTSGTTGRPKGVIQTHRNNSAAVAMLQESWEITRSDRFLVAVPLFHVGGMQCAALPALATGAVVHLLPRWSPDAWLSVASRYRPTVTGLVTTMLVDLIRAGMAHPENIPDLSSLRIAMMGGSPTPFKVVDDFHRLYGVGLKELYGQTELTGLAVTYRADEAWRPGSMGRPMSHVLETAVSVDDRVVHPVTAPVTGDLCFRGETVSPGYWHLPDQTQARWRDGWYRTGDIVSVDGDGYLIYRDRSDDMIVTGGENVYPAEVEALLSEIPQIRQVAVIGTPHPRWGEQVTAVIVPREPDLTVDDMVQAISRHTGLADYKRPRRIELLAELPRTGSGKVNRTWLKQTYGGK